MGNENHKLEVIKEREGFDEFVARVLQESLIKQRVGRPGAIDDLLQVVKNRIDTKMCQTTENWLRRCLGGE